jgi:DNA-binding CsgD family transcriptional regulator
LNREVKLPKPIWETGEIVLHPKDYLFSLEFAALDYSAPQKNQYAYKLEGLTEDWIHTDSRHRMASFSRLPAGKYFFKVKGSNSDGLWNEQESSLVIRVRGPWWKSWWFLSLLAGSALLICFELNRTRIRRLAARIKTEEAMDQFFAKCALSPREREIALLLLKGLSNKEIGEKLFIELSTVKIHVHRILKKLGVGNRTQLVRLFQNLKT